MHPLFSSILALLLATACAGPLPPPLEPIQFNQRSPITLNLASLEIAQAFRSTGQPTFIEHSFPTPPAAAAERWFRERVQISGGGAYHGEAVIREASVKRTMLPVTPGFEGTFRKEQAERLDAVLEAEVKIFGPDRVLPETTIQIRVDRMQTLGERISLSARDHAYQELTRALMADFDREAERQMRDHFGRYSGF
jgi:hypothetical protein